jgi:S-adenosylmethionine:tRNA ribosyltransferase-isomerase
MIDMRLLLVDSARGWVGEAEPKQLSSLLSPRDLVVVNDAATLPAALTVSTEAGELLEIRLLDAPYRAETRAVLFGPGSYLTPTEHRAPPPVLRVGAVLHVASSRLVVSSVSSISPRLLTLRWEGDASARFALLYRAGRAVQYSYVPEPLALWDVQTSFATRPWAVEMPSAARPLTASVLLALRRRGVELVALTHAAGLSATGDPALDAALPLPERYEIPAHTVAALARTHARGGRVLAVGTTVVRALEDSVHKHGEVVAGPAIANLVLSEQTTPRVVSGLLTGIHVPGESHYRLLSALCPQPTLERATAVARARGYRLHEFGDAALIFPHIEPRVRLGERAASQSSRSGCSATIRS